MSLVQRAHRRNESIVRPTRRCSSSVERSAAIVSTVCIYSGFECVAARLRAASARVASAKASQTGSDSGECSAIAARCLLTVASSPRAIGPVSADAPPAVRAQFSTADRTNGIR